MVSKRVRWPVCGRVPFLVAVAVLMLFLGSGGVPKDDPAFAQPVGTIDNVSIDMDPGAAPANTPTSVGSVEACARVDNNNILDADEDGPADNVLADVVVHPLGIPPSPPDGGLVGFKYDLNFVNGGVVVNAFNNALLIAAMGLSPIDLSDGVPDAVTPWKANMSDLLGGQETGPGQLTQLTLEGVGAGLHPLSLTNINILDGATNLPYPINNINGALLAVDVPCPAPTDVKLVSQTVTFPSTIDVSLDELMIIDKVIHNNGLEPVIDVLITKTITMPPDCTVNGQPGPVVVINDVLFAVDESVPTPYQEIDIIHCAEPSDHQITVENCIEPDSVLPDPDPSNNCQTTIVNFTVIGQSDVKISSQTITAPGAPVIPPLPYPRVLVNATQAVDIDKVLHNNGPYGPVNVTYGAGGAFVPNAGGTWNQQPGDCTTTPVVPGGAVSLPVSGAGATPTEQFTIQCNDLGMGNDTDGDTLIDEDAIDGLDDDLDGPIDEDSPFQFAMFCFMDQVTVTGTHVEDPDPSNNIIDGSVDPGQGCITLAIVRDFNPIFTVQQGIAPPSPPVGVNCPVTLPCEQNFYYGFPAGEPTADTVIVIPGDGTPTGDFYITNGFNDPVNGNVPNGTVVGAGAFSVTLKIGPGAAPCNITVSDTFTLEDGAIPAFYGEGPDDGTALALFDPTVWPTRLEASPLFQAFNTGGPGYVGAPVWSRATDYITALGLQVNVITFNLGAGGWATVLITGDPSVPPNPMAPQTCSPITVQSDFLGETAAGTDLRVCNVVNTDPGHMFVAQFQRTDTSESVMIPQLVTCSPVESDEKLESQTVTVPPQIYVSENADLIIDKLIHNNGPAELVDVEITKTISVPADCTVNGQPDAVGITDILEGVAISVTTPYQEIDVIHCTAPSFHQIMVENCVAPADPAISDPNGGNNCTTTLVDFEVIALADLKISDQEILSPPSEMQVSEDVPFTVRKTLHNNGPYGPVTATVLPSMLLPPDCTAAVPPAPAFPPAGTDNLSTTLVLPDVIVDMDDDGVPETSLGRMELFGPTIVERQDPGDSDLNGLREIHTEIVSMTLTGGGLTIIESPTLPSTGVTEALDPSNDFPADSFFDVFVELEGTPYGTLTNPIPARVETTIRTIPPEHSSYHAEGPIELYDAGNVHRATLTEVYHKIERPFTVDLPVSVPVVVEETYYIHCEEPSFHEFEFENRIEPPLHVEDPDISNNFLSTPITLPVIAQADKEVLDVIFDDGRGKDLPEPATASGAITAVGPAETGGQCSNGLDDDGDSVPDDGCAGVTRQELGATEKNKESIISVTSLETNNGPADVPDALVEFFASIPANCKGVWVPLDPAKDERTRGGDPFAPSYPPDPTKIVPWSALPELEDGDGDPTTYEADIHFQTADYGLDEPAMTSTWFTRYFRLVCTEDSAQVDNDNDGSVDEDPPNGVDDDSDTEVDEDGRDAFIFKFCNKITPKPHIEDPNPDNNVKCDILLVKVEVEETDVNRHNVGQGDDAGNDGLEIFFKALCQRNCDKIRFIQVVCLTAVLGDGRRIPINPTDTGFGAEKDNRTVNGEPIPEDPGDPGGASNPRRCWLDRANINHPPYYGTPGWHTPGRHNAPAPPIFRDGMMGDAPQWNRHKDNRFFNTMQNRLRADGRIGATDTVDGILLEFETCIFCESGGDVGRVYGCKKWTWTQSRGDSEGTVTHGSTSASYSDQWANAANRWADRLRNSAGQANKADDYADWNGKYPGVESSPGAGDGRFPADP